MDSNDIPDEYIDTLVQEFAYDPILLDVNEDPAQVLYNRRTLEKIWNMKHDAVNPYTRQPFDIKNAIPHTNLRLQMRQYIVDNPTLSQTLGLEVISDYTRVLSSRDMKHLLNELVFNYRYLLDYDSPSLNLDEAVKKYWKNLWQKLNLLRLYCQYSEENKETFLSIKGYENLFHVVNEPLRSLFREHHPSCEYAMEVCIEIAKIVDVIGLRGRDLISIPDNCVRAFARILCDLAESEYLKIQSMVLRICFRLFYAGIIYSLGYNDALPRYVIEIAQYLLWRQNSRDITNEDLYNGMAILSIAWTKNEFVILNFIYYVDLLVKVVVICITRLQDLNAAVAVDDGDSCSRNDIHLLSFALTEGLRSIQSLVTPDTFYLYEKERLKNLDIIKEVVRIAELVVAGFKIFEPIHLRYGLSIAMVLYQQYGSSVIRKNDVEIFGKLLESDIVNIVNEYGEDIRIMLQALIRAEYSIGVECSYD